jgi:membrane-bound lytic murein transglycosylase MltF/cytochrome c553
LRCRLALPLCALSLTLALALCAVESAQAAAPQPLAIDLEATHWTGDLDALAAHRAIRVLVPYSKTLYFVDLGGRQRGMCYDFMHAFEDALNRKLGRETIRVHVVFIPVSRDRLLPMLESGEGDVVAANLTVTPERASAVDFVTPVARGIREIVVTGPGAPTLRSLDDLAGREIFVARTSSYYESLATLNQSFGQRGLPLMHLRLAPGHFETEDILEMLNSGLVKIAIADEYLANFWSQIYPHLALHPELAVRTGGDIAFAIRKGSPRLKAELDEFTLAHRAGTLFGNVELRNYLKQTRWAKDATSQSELEKFNRLVTLFRRYGDEYRVDWLLMAAQGYQESQFDQSRHSSAGAIGVMQVTAATGREMQVGDVTQLDANIHAGIKYVRFMVDTYYNEPQIDELNRVLFAFAAYNAGPNRIRALRNLAAERGLNPNVWFDNVERIAAERIGRETVQYVSNIYKYYIAYSLVQEDVERTLEKAPATAVAAERPDWAFFVPTEDSKRLHEAEVNVLNPPDWYPGEHAPMPSIVAHGVAARAGVPPLMPCALCHLPNGAGHVESASIAALPAAYIERQFTEWRDGTRQIAEGDAAVRTMLTKLKQSYTPEQIKEAAAYYAASRPRRWIQVVETGTVRHTAVNTQLMRIALPQSEPEPIGERIIELPQDEAKLLARDSHSGFIAYVPRGSVAEGARLVAKAGPDGAYACANCHGAKLTGLADAPPLAGRPPSYIVRQLWAFQRGERHGSLSAPMQLVAAPFTQAQMIAIAAYLASQPPE